MKCEFKYKIKCLLQNLSYFTRVFCYTGIQSSMVWRILQKGIHKFRQSNGPCHFSNNSSFWMHKILLEVPGNNSILRLAFWNWFWMIHKVPFSSKSWCLKSVRNFRQNNCLAFRLLGPVFPAFARFLCTLFKMKHGSQRNHSLAVLFSITDQCCNKMSPILLTLGSEMHYL